MYLGTILGKYFMKLGSIYWITAIVMCMGVIIGNAQYVPANSIVLKAKPYKKDGVFKNGSKAGFTIRIKNEANYRQSGTLNIEVKSSNGNLVYHDNPGFYVGSNRADVKELELNKTPLQPGFYIVYLAATTAAGVSYTSATFAIDPERMTVENNRPADFASFWENAKRDLFNTNPNFQVVKRGDLSSNSIEVNEISYQSIENNTIRGILTVPKGKGKFPVLIQYCDYVTEVKPEMMQDYAVLSINVRGVGTSRDQIKGDYYNYNIYNLKDKSKYIYRGAYMDALRAVEFVFSNQNLKLNADKIITMGTGQGATLACITAAMDKRVKGLAMDRPLYMDFRSMINVSESQKNNAWPASSFIGFYNAKANGVTKQALLQTLDYFDPLNFAPFIACPVLIGFASGSISLPAQCAYTFLNQLRVEKKDSYVCHECNNNMESAFYGFQNVWLKEVCNIP